MYYVIEDKDISERAVNACRTMTRIEILMPMKAKIQIGARMSTRRVYNRLTMTTEIQGQSATNNGGLWWRTRGLGWTMALLTWDGSETGNRQELSEKSD